MKSNKPLAERLLALLLAGVTAFSSVPTAALAEAVEALNETAPVEAAADVDPAEGEQGAETTANAEKTEVAAEAAQPEVLESAEPEAAELETTEAPQATAPVSAADAEKAAEGSDEPAALSVADESVAVAPVATEGENDLQVVSSDSMVSVSFQLIGITADGADEAWITKTYQVERGSNAADLIETALTDAGLTHTSTYDTTYGYYLSDITFKDGRKLEYDAVTGKYWQLFVDGEASQVGASSVSLSAGTSVLLYYSSYDVVTQSASVSIVGPDASGGESRWVSSANYEFVDGATAADAIEQVLDGAGLEHEASGKGAASYYLSSITRDGVTYGWDATTGKFWQLFLNGKCSEVGAGGVTLAAGDRIQLVYSAWGDTAVAKASVEVIGLDFYNMAESWGSLFEYSFQRGEATVADASEALFASAGITADYGQSTWGWSLNSITHDGITYAYDQTTGQYWQLFINGEASSTMADGYTLQPGDRIVWAYSCYGDEVPEPGAKNAVASIELIGLDENGNAARWGALSGWKFEAGATAAELTEAFFKSTPVAASYGDGGYGWSLNSVTSPFDASMTLGTAQDASGNWLYWQLFVNGVSAASMADGITLKDGDSVQWVYCSYGDDPASGVIVDPGAAAPDWDSDWSGYTSADKVTDAATPTKDAEAKWVAEVKKSSDWTTYVSDPVLAGDYLYIAAGSTLYKKSVETGETVEGGTAALAEKIDSTSRIAYADGLIIVPLSSGRLQALTADTLATKWVTPAVAAGTMGAQQSLSSLTVRDGYAYFGTSDADWSGTYGGYLQCVRLSDGHVMWSRANENSAGYYWTGVAFAGGYGVVADDSGTVSVLDPATGDVVSTLKVADRVRATTLVDGSDIYVVSNDGVLHKLTLGSDGKLSEVASAQFGYSSTSTPVLAGGKIIVGGTSTEFFKGGYQGNYEYHYGQIAVIDAATMTVEKTVDKADGSYIRQYGYDAGGDVKSQPVVSVQDGETYVYFTSNNEPGCIYRYCVGDEEAEVLYTPESADQQYCMASIAVGSDGALYYTNDSGKLFAVKGNGKRAQRYIVSFDLNGGTGETPAPQKVKEGSTATKPADSVRAGYRFCGWYADTACTKAWDFASGVTCDMTLTAKWEAKGGATPGGGAGGTDSGAGAGSDSGGADSTAGSIFLTGNGSANGSAKGSGSSSATLAGALKSSSATTVESSATAAETFEGLLVGFASGEMSSTASDDAGSSASGAATAEAAQPAAPRGVPIWPFIGMGAGAVALVAVVATKRKMEDEQ